GPSGRECPGGYETVGCSSPPCPRKGIPPLTPPRYGLAWKRSRTRRIAVRSPSAPRHRNLRRQNSRPPPGRSPPCRLQREQPPQHRLLRPIRLRRHHISTLLRSRASSPAKGAKRAAAVRQAAPDIRSFPKLGSVQR